MTDGATEPELWHKLSWPWRLLVLVAALVLICGAFVWRLHFNDVLFYWGVGMVMLGGITLWAVYLAKREKSQHDT